MKHLLLILFLLWAVWAGGQVPLDSAFWDTEMEDSISSLSIKPIKKPKKLLDSILLQLTHDLEKKPTIHKYKAELICSNPAPYSIRCSMLAESGIRLEMTGDIEDFTYEGKLKLTQKDRKLYEFGLMICSTAGLSLIKYLGFLPARSCQRFRLSSILLGSIISQPILSVTAQAEDKLFPPK